MTSLNLWWIIRLAHLRGAHNGCSAARQRLRRASQWRQTRHRTSGGSTVRVRLVTLEWRQWRLFIAPLRIQQESLKTPLMVP